MIMDKCECWNEFGPTAENPLRKAREAGRHGGLSRLQHCFLAWGMPALAEHCGKVRAELSDPLHDDWEEFMAESWLTGVRSKLDKKLFRELADAFIRLTEYIKNKPIQFPTPPAPFPDGTSPDPADSQAAMTIQHINGTRLTSPPQMPQRYRQAA